MKVLILNQAFYPDVVSTAQHAADLAVALVQAGHSVTVIAGNRGYDDPQLRFPAREQWRGVHIVRLGALGLGKASRWRRAVGFAWFMSACALRLLMLPRVDVIVAMTSPPLISFLAALAVPMKAKRLVVWAMDVNPDEAIAAGWLRERSLTARSLAAMLRYSLRRAAAVVVLDRFMRERILAKGVSPANVHTVPPWAHDDVVRFDDAGRQRFREQHGLGGRFVVMYSGNHSPCHPLDTVLEAAERLRSHPEIVFCFVGGGSEHARLRRRAQELGLENVLCLPYQPLEQLAGSLSAADLHVVVMGDAFRGIVHPCKIYNVIAVGAPFLYVGPAQSHLTDLAQDLPAAAWSSHRHGDVEGVIRHVLRAAGSAPSPRSANGLQRFSRSTLAPDLVHIIEQAAAPPAKG
ncbi:MAG TPA: glycosyltransferase family 4 protein [Terriglobales bacterium]|nr:glycosyltransferase family 4 protein [Terriglobales bacterium]